MSVDINIKLLKEYDLLRDVKDKDLEIILDKIEIINISNNEIIIQEGDEGNSIVFLFDGEVSINQIMTLPTSNIEEDTREKEIYNTSFKDKPVFGEIGLFGKSDKRTANIKAISNCTIGLFYKNDFFNICEQDKEVGYIILKNISRIISDRIKDSNLNITKLTTALSLILDK